PGRAAGPPDGGAGSRLLRRPPGQAVLREPVLVHEPGALPGPGAGGRERHPALARPDGGHRLPEGGAGDHPGRLRLVHRGQRRARLRLAGVGRVRDPLLLLEPGDPPPLIPRRGARLHPAPARPLRPESCPAGDARAPAGPLVPLGAGGRRAAIKGAVSTGSRPAGRSTPPTRTRPAETSSTRSRGRRSTRSGAETAARLTRGARTAMLGGPRAGPERPGRAEGTWTTGGAPRSDPAQGPARARRPAKGPTRRFRAPSGRGRGWRRRRSASGSACASSASTATWPRSRCRTATSSPPWRTSCTAAPSAP